MSRGRYFRADSTAFLMIFLAFGQLTFSQVTTTASISGTIKDETGAVLPGARVIIRNVETALSRSVLSDASGSYLITNLPPGEYELSAELVGFSKHIQSGLKLTVGQVAIADIVMKLGEITEEVEVTAEEALMEITSADISRIVGTQQIVELPISGRNFVDFVLLSSGVAPGRGNIGGGAFKELDIGVGSAAVTRLSFGGQQEFYTLVQIDGSDNTQTITGLQRAAPSLETAREFRVLNSTYTAEFGRAWANVNIITKSGTNDYHGSIYYFGMNDNLNARPALKRLEADDLRQNQFGFTLGGPIKKDRTFFFANYEGQRRDESNSFSQVILDNLDAINRVRSSFGLKREVDDLLVSNDYDEFLAKGDHQFTLNKRISARYNFISSEARNFLGGGGRASPTSSTARNNFVADQSLVINSLSVLSPQWVKESLFQFGRRSFDFPSIRNEPAIELPNLIIMGKSTSDVDFYRESRFQWSDSLSYTKGKHNIKGGFEINHLRDTTRWLLFAPARIIFPGLAGLLGLPPFRAPTPVVFQWLAKAGDPINPSLGTAWDRAIPPQFDELMTFKVNHNSYGFFAQDQWRATSRLTFNYGIRYEFETYPSEFVKNDLSNWQPRVGFAYAFADNAVIRGGFGIFHARQFNTMVAFNAAGLTFSIDRDHPLRKLRNFTGVEGIFRQLFIFGPPRATPAALNLLTTGRFPPTADGLLFAWLFERELPTPYSEQASLAASYSPFKDLAVSASYLYVHGVKLPATSGNINAFQTGTLPSGKPFFGGRIDPSVGVLFAGGNRGGSVYHGGTFEAKKAFSDNFSFHGSYTVSKVIDDVGGGGGFDNLAEFSENNDMRLDRALSKQDVRHRFTLAFMGEGPQRFFLTRDFKLGVIVTLASGRPLTIFAGVDANGDGNPLSDRPGALGRSTFPGDGLVNFDVRLSRRIKFTEQVKGEFIAEFFNLFNTANINDFNTVWGSADLSTPPPPILGFATPRSTLNPRQIQYAFRLTF